MATAAVHVAPISLLNREVASWVDEVARLTQPERIHWCDGSDAEYQQLERELVAKKDLLAARTRPTFPAAICIARIRRMSRASSI